MNLANFTDHHIEGYAAAAYERGLPSHFAVPLISHIEGNLYMGGCEDGVPLHDDFDLVVSMYMWEKFRLGPNTERVEFKAYDSEHVPLTPALDAALLAYNALAEGKKVLIHCQAGLNRSGLVAALVLMKQGRSAREAIDLLRERRCDLVLCNLAFETYLLGDKG